MRYTIKRWEKEREVKIKKKGRKYRYAISISRKSISEFTRYVTYVPTRCKRGRERKRDIEGKKVEIQRVFRCQCGTVQDGLFFFRTHAHFLAVSLRVRFRYDLLSSDNGFAVSEWCSLFSMGWDWLSARYPNGIIRLFAIRWDWLIDWSHRIDEGGKVRVPKKKENKL